MPRAEPLITPEELHSLLGGAPARSRLHGRGLWHNMQTLHGGAALWLVKGIFLYAVLMNPEAASLVGNSRYLWMRSSLELVCLALFWGAAMHPRGRTVARGSMLVASTTWLMDAMTLWAFAG
jgi:hypothetical protein